MRFIELLNLWVAAGTTFLVLLFVRALLHKVSDVERFKGFLANYGVLPHAWLKAGANFLIGVEGLIIALLITPTLNSVGAVLAMGLLMLYAGVIALNIAKGNVLIECGCGGPAMHLSYGLVLRNLVIACVGLPMVLIQNTKLPLIDTSIAVACGAILYLFYIVAEQLLANFNHIQLLHSKLNDRN
ncbi:MAG: MauE/DoxX family redox-associated membrane protein [Methylophilaceae bacterium]